MGCGFLIGWMIQVEPGLGGEKDDSKSDWAPDPWTWLGLAGRGMQILPFGWLSLLSQQGLGSQDTRSRHYLCYSVGHLLAKRHRQK